MKSHMMDAQSRSRRILLAMLACWSALAAGTAQAQAWPAKPIRFIVPFPPGGATDVLTRTIAPRLADALGQQVVVDNRSGAGGMIGVQLTAKAPPDGYTLVLATFGPIAINPSLYAKMPYDPIKELAPVSLAGNIYNVLVVHPALPAPSVKDLIALARQRPGELNYGSSGPGAADHMAAELFQVMTRTRMVHVPYKGGPLAMVDLISGNLQLMFSTVPTAAGLIKAGKLRPDGDREQHAFSGDAGAADRLGSGRAGLRGQQLVRRIRGGRNAAGGYRASECRAGKGAGDA